VPKESRVISAKAKRLGLSGQDQDEGKPKDLTITLMIKKFTIII